LTNPYSFITRLCGVFLSEKNLARRAYLGLLRKMTAIERGNISSSQSLLWDNAIAECIRYQQMICIRLIEACSDLSGSMQDSMVENSAILEMVKRIHFEADNSSWFRLMNGHSTAVTGDKLIRWPANRCENGCPSRATSLPLSSSLLPPRQVEPQDNVEAEIMSTSKFVESKTSPSKLQKVADRKTPQATVVTTSPSHLLESNVQEVTIDAVSTFLARIGKSHDDSLQEMHPWKDVHIVQFSGPCPQTNDTVNYSNIEGSGSKVLKEIVQRVFHLLSLRQREESLCSDANSALRKQAEAAKRVIKNNIEQSFSHLFSIETRIKTYAEEIKLCLNWIHEEGAILAHIEVIFGICYNL